MSLFLELMEVVLCLCLSNYSRLYFLNFVKKIELYINQSFT